MSRRAISSRSGFILVAVLTVLALLAALMAAVQLIGRSNVAMARVGAADLATKAMTEAAAELAGYQLFALGIPPARVSGQEIRLDIGRITLGVTTTATRIDLNRSSAKLIASAYAASGAKSLTPEAFAARVVDWRDKDDDPGERGGAERDAYDAAGLAWHPPNGPFLSVDDLRWLAGLAAEDVPKLTPFFTVFNPGGTLDALAASPDMLKRVPGLANPIITRILRLRATPTDASLEAIKGLIGEASAMVSVGGGEVFEVTAELRPADGSRAVAVFVLARDLSGKSPYLVLDRRLDFR